MPLVFCEALFLVVGLGCLHCLLRALLPLLPLGMCLALNCFQELKYPKALQPRNAGANDTFPVVASH